MISEELLRRFWERFDVNVTRYAKGRPNSDNPAKYNYVKIDEPLTFDVLREHLQGAVTIGVYPVRADHTARWFAVDYDAPKDRPPEIAFEEALRAALKQQQQYAKAGLFTHIERSRSGSGVHLWGFLREPMAAKPLRQVMLDLLLPELNLWVDRAKTYPADPERSTNQTLICLPYGGAWTPKGCTMFFDAKGTWSLEEFLDSAKINANEAVERVHAKLPKQRPARMVVGGTPAEISPEGRPVPLFTTGIMKLFSPLGCRFLHHTWRDRHEQGDRKVSEPEWYAALGQLSAFAEGRKAAHLLWNDTQYYNAPGMDEKFDHACRNPPNGCQFIHERFPRWACEGCAMTAPYRLAEKPLLELSKDSVGDVQTGEYDEDRLRIERRNTGRELPGLEPGVHGMSRVSRIRNTELMAVGAQPSIGKTALMVDMCCNLGSAGIDVYMFSAESSREVVHDRLIAHESLVDSRALRGERSAPLSSSEWKQVDLALEQLRKLPIFENYAATEPEDMLRLIESDLIRRGSRWSQQFVVLFDYLQYGLEMLPGESGEYRAINRRLFELKALRKVLERPVIFFSQLTRDTEGKDEPAMNWWSGSGKIEQVIDQGWIITGERVEGPVAPRTIHVVKQKEGVVGAKVDFVLHQAVCRYEARAETVKMTSPDPLFESWMTNE